MKTIKAAFVGALAVAGVMALGSFSQPALAKGVPYNPLNNDSTTSQYYMVVRKPFHAKTNKNVYMWNYNHTKKLHNLKNYPKTTWYRIETISKIKNGKKVPFFYKVTNGSEKFSGYVSAKNLIPGHNPATKHKYTVESAVTDDDLSYYTHLKDPSKNAYLWNGIHTKKIVNLKDLSNFSWWVNSAKSVISHNGKKAVYYYVYSIDPRDNSSQKYKGWIWHGYLKKGFNPNYKILNNVGFGVFDNSVEYARYIQESPSQELTRNILKLFPNATLSTKLTESYTDYTQTEALGFKDVIDFSFVTKYMYNEEGKKKLTDAQRFKLIKKGLEEHGYDKAKRESLKDYQIGIAYYQDIDEWPDARHGFTLARPTADNHSVDMDKR